MGYSNFNVIVLAAGKGTRMKSNLPKVIHKLCGEEMINVVIDHIKEAGFKKIACVLGFKRALIEKILPPGIKRIPQTLQLGTAHAVGKTKNFLDCENVLILYADHPLIHPESLKEVANTHKRIKADLTLLTVKLEDPKDFGRILRDNKGKIREIKESLELNEEEKRITEVNPGLMCFKKESLFQNLKKIKINKKKKEYFFTEIVKVFYKEGKKVAEVKSRFPEEDGLGVNTLSDLAQAQEFLIQRTNG